MNSVTSLIFFFLVIAVSAAPQLPVQTLEDPAPVTKIITCGGLIDASSAQIDLQVGGSIRADQRCIWLVKPPLNRQRFSLTSTGLGENDGLFVSTYMLGVVGPPIKISTVGQNHTLTSDLVMVTLSVGHGPTRGFSLTYFSSGSYVGPVLTGYTELTATAGNYSYPEDGGNYRNSENALFVIAPSVPGRPTLRFTFVELEFEGNCSYDSVRIFNWFDNNYIEVSRFCGTTIPPSLTLIEGAGIVTFRSDSSEVRRGFKFEWV
ncbi:cubilin [Folsomia candida]|uniref:Zinc metalloproteinase nas-39 n=1 Tax=Folsomia candida TaxID=158441 RepID=A0A226F0I1_FOLCA|nr:cubilin [Folsomia candida]OXA62671.1 Zinc metalloproteinase nas-39 [Folsomia candida]